MDQHYFSGGWPFEPAPRGARISRDELTRRQAALAQAPLFASLSKRQLRSLSEVTAVTAYEEGREVVKEGDAGSALYVLLEGRAKVVRNRRTVAHLSAGHFFGEISVLDGGPRTASVIAETHLRCLVLEGASLMELVKREASLAARILGEVAGRLRRSERSPVG